MQGRNKKPSRHTKSSSSIIYSRKQLSLQFHIYCYIILHIRLWSGPFKFLWGHIFSAPSLFMLCRTKDDITSAAPLPAAHMKNKIMAVTYSFIQSTYSHDCTLLHYPHHLHIRILYIYGFALLHTFFFTAFLLLSFTTFTSPCFTFAFG